MSRMTWETFQQSNEYILWKDLNRVANEYGINEDNYFKKTDLSGEYWEPFFDRLYKMGCMLGYTKKLREIKMDWMRPILYFGAQSQGIIEFDGRRDEVNKGAISNAILVKFSFKSVINAIHNFSNLDDKNFHKEYISFKKDLKYYFIQLSKFVKDGFITMHNHVKLVLKPLLDLRKSGYRLFSLEQYEDNNRHLTMFNDKKDLTIFLESSKDFFKWQKYKQSKDAEGDKLKEFIQLNTSRERLHYTFSHEKREIVFRNNLNPYATNATFHKDIAIIDLKSKIKNSHSKKNDLLPEIFRIKKRIEKNDDKKYERMIFPNITNLDQPEPTKLKHEAYQLKFEEGLNSMIEYLNRRLMKDFPYTIDTHKIFTNIKYVPNGKTEIATNFYINRLIDQIEILKEKCYEMKLNGLSRILMPITENRDIIKVIKEIFDLHVIIDNVMGNYLLYDQYMFIYNSIKFLIQSSLSEQIEQIKNRNFMEELVPKYVFFQSLCHSVKVLEKMKKYYKEELGKIFKYEDSYQISEHELDQEDNELIFAYEIYGPYKRFFVPSLQERKEKYDNEVKKFGRFWLMEGFFNKNDKNLWIETIESLSNINVLVREDIRDSILKPKKEKENEKIIKDINTKSNKNENVLNSSHKDSKIQISSHNSSSSSSIANNINKRKSIKINDLKKNDSRKNFQDILKIKKKKSKEKNLFLKRKTFVRQKTKNSFDYTKIDLNSFRPPNVWNYPIYKLRKLKNEKKDIIINEIRDVDPTKCYVDGRIQKFNQMFDNLYNNMTHYWNTGKKADTWEYFYDKVLKALKINYVSNKALKREEALKRQLEEEDKKKKENEEIEMKKQLELMNKELGKNETNDISKMINNTESTNNNITNNITNNNTNSNKKEDKKENKSFFIKKIKITKDKDSKLFKTKINIKDEGVTNETTS